MWSADFWDILTLAKKMNKMVIELGLEMPYWQYNLSGSVDCFSLLNLVWTLKECSIIITNIDQ